MVTMGLPDERSNPDQAPSERLDGQAAARAVPANPGNEVATLATSRDLDGRARPQRRDRERQGDAVIAAAVDRAARERFRAADPQAIGAAAVLDAELAQSRGHGARAGSLS